MTFRLSRALESCRAGLLVVLALAAGSGVRSQESSAPNLRVSFDPRGEVNWTLPFTNGLVAIDWTTNLNLQQWLPLRALQVTNAQGSFAVPVTNRNALFRVTTRAAGSAPIGLRLVPGGHFVMGDNNPSVYGNEMPQHTVFVSTFYVDPLEVSNLQMRDALEWAFGRNLITVDRSKMARSVGAQPQPLVQCKGIPDSIAHNEVNFDNGVFYVDVDKTNNPCVGITWYGALSYCNWRSEREGLNPCYNLTDWTCDFTKNGYRLPTEAEWEKAARGGMVGQSFPWPSPSVGNSFVRQIETNMATFTPVGLPHPFRTTPVGNYNGTQTPAGPDTMNGYGLYDVVGNVREWCWDWYDQDFYSRPEASTSDPTGPVEGQIITFPNGTKGPTRVTRGGSFDEPQKNIRCSFRGQPYQSSPSYGHWYHGLRCVRRP